MLLIIYNVEWNEDIWRQASEVIVRHNHSHTSHRAEKKLLKLVDKFITCVCVCVPLALDCECNKIVNGGQWLGDGNVYIY